MSIVDLIFPKACLDCGKGNKYICDDCLSKVRILKPVCPYCEKPSIDGFTHPGCARKYGLDGLTSAWKYEGVIKKAILALKFRHATEIVSEISAFYTETLRKSYTPKDSVLIPIPIYWYRENQRGFNQSELVGKGIVAKTDWRFEPDFLVKNKQTASQVELPIRERKKNLRGVFSINPLKKIVPNVILFDDVFTTGSTLSEACKVLKKAGVQKVWGLVVAR